MLKKTNFVFRINDNGIGPDLLYQVCSERGWICYDDCNSNCTNPREWNLWWRTKRFPVTHTYINNEQFINHIPRASFICRKDNLIRSLKCMKKIYGTPFNFVPEGYNLPLEYKKLVKKYKISNEEQNKKIWICKPVGLSQGRGITLFQDPDELVYSTNVLVQEYIKNPLLISGYKFDLRLYVIVPSFHPLTVYIYREGLVRFSTEKYSLLNLKNKFAHLTNSSLNKFSPGYLEKKERIGSGCKWRLQQLRCYLQQTIGSDWLLWLEISCIIVLTISSQLSRVPNTINSFEFYGFDVLIDSHLKPWLVEVNLNPALSTDCMIDPLIKKPMIHEMFDLLGLPIYNTGLSRYACKNISEKSEKLKSGNKSKTKKRGQRTLYKNVKSKSDTKWGNGENWNNSKGVEGDWVRVFPLLCSENQRQFKRANSTVNDYKVFSTDEVKHVVTSVVSLLKIMKNIKEYKPEIEEEEIQKLMSPYLLPGANIWFPPV